MTMKLFNTSSVQDIANAIRARNGLSRTYKIAEMASAISSIATDGTATADKIFSGYTAYGLNGQKMVGTASDSGGTAIVVTDEPDEHGGTIRYINGVSLDGDTVSAGTMFSGVTAHNSLGSSITGTYVPPTIEVGYGRGQDRKTTIFPPYGADAMSTFVVGSTQLGSVNIVPSESSQVITPPSDTLVYGIVTSNTSSTGGKYTKSFTFPTSFHEWYRLKGEVYRQGLVTPTVINFTFPMPYYYDNGAWYNFNGEQVDSSSEVARAIRDNGYGGIEIILTLSSLTLDIGGNYNITVHPTGLYEPSDYDGYNHIDVEPISSTYVGSGIPSMSSSNLAFATGTGVFTAPSGYYSTNATYTLTPKTSENITFNYGNGVFTVSSGYYSSSPTLTLSTKAGTTITPTESEQIAVSSYYFTKGSIKVAGISSDYVGTNVSRMSSSNLTFATGTGVFTAPKGYYSTNATYTLTPKTATNIAFNSRTGVFTVSSGYYSSNPTLALSTRAGTTITPISTGSRIAVSSGYFAIGSVYVGAIPSTYVQPTGTLNISSNGTFDVTNYASASVSVEGGEYYVIYRSIANCNVLYWNYTGLSSLSQFFGELTSIPYGMFANRPIYGEYTFSNVSQISTCAFEFGATFATGLGCTLHFPICTSINSKAFFYNPNIKHVDIPLFSGIIGEQTFQSAWIETISAPLVVSTYSSAFASCRIKEINFPECLLIGADTFIQCRSLSYASLPKCTELSTRAFQACVNLESIYLPECTSVGYLAFQYCSLIPYLDSTNFTNLQLINSSAFQYCRGLSYIDLSKVTCINMRAFDSCYNLLSVNLPVCSEVNQYAFVDCSSLATVQLPLCSYVGGTAFGNCTLLSYISIPNASIIGGQAFIRCSALTSISLPNCTSISTYVFSSCSNFMSIYLFGSVVPSISQYTFAYSPMSQSVNGVYGSIYVKASMYNSFLANSVWSRYAARIVSLTDAQIALL